MTKLASLFFVTAILYASVGFGGGSTYNALLVLAGTDFDVLPSVALICNIIVVSGGTWHFHKEGHIPWGKVWPLFVLSIPFAWLGGRIPIPEAVFVLILGFTLLIAACAMLLQTRSQSYDVENKRIKVGIPIIGGGLGFMSGLVGIGGGVFLAPILHLTKWGRAKSIAGICSAFILVNSIAGLVGQMTKLNTVSDISRLYPYWLLFVAVFIGGQIGSRIGAQVVSAKWIKIFTAILILFVALRLLFRSAHNFQVI